MAGRVDVLVQQVLACHLPQCHCLSLRYTMDGVHTGTLNLLKDNRCGGSNRCLWRSEKTKLSTDWHGSWFQLEQNKILVHFDCYGVKTNGEKWALLKMDGIGQDHRARQIQVELLGAYILDEIAMQFVLR